MNYIVFFNYSLCHHEHSLDYFARRLFCNQLYVLSLDCSEKNFYDQLSDACYPRVCANSHLKKDIALMLCKISPV